MERELNVSKKMSRRDFIKAAGTVAVGSFTTVALGASILEAHQTRRIELYPQDIFKPAIIDRLTLASAEKVHVSSSHALIPEVSKPLSRKEKLLIQVRLELPGIVRKMETHPEVFSKKKIDDFIMYYPIYKAVGDMYDVDPLIIYIIHEAETGASVGEAGFAPGRQVQGAMQIDRMWKDKYLNPKRKGYAAKGLEYLRSFPQRHKDDWENIAAGTKILKRNMKGKKMDVLNGLKHYCSEEQALIRFDLYKKYKKILKVRPSQEVIFRRAVA